MGKLITMYRKYFWGRSYYSKDNKIYLDWVGFYAGVALLFVLLPIFLLVSYGEDISYVLKITAAHDLVGILLGILMYVTVTGNVLTIRGARQSPQNNRKSNVINFRKAA